MKLSWIIIFAICIAASVVILVISKQKSTPEKCIEEPVDNHSDTCSIVSSHSEYDLYDNIHDFMTKQTSYIKTLG